MKEFYYQIVIAISTMLGSSYLGILIGYVSIPMQCLGAGIGAGAGFLLMKGVELHTSILEPSTFRSHKNQLIRLEFSPFHTAMKYLQVPALPAESRIAILIKVCVIKIFPVLAALFVTLVAVVMSDFFDPEPNWSTMRAVNMSALAVCVLLVSRIGAWLILFLTPWMIFDVIGKSLIRLKERYLLLLDLGDDEKPK